MRLRCKACRGEFDDTTRDGLRYFHTCPPVLMARVERGGQWIDVPLADVQAADMIEVSRDGATVKVQASTRGRDDVRLGDTIAERPNHRDENVQVVDYDKAGNAVTAPKREGAGVELLRA